MDRINFSNFGKRLIILSALAFSMILPVAASAQTVNLSPATSNLGQNQNFSLELRVSSVNDLFNPAFDLSYNPSLIQFISATDGGFLSQNNTTPIFMLTSATTPGTLVFGATRLGQVGGVSGSGVIAILNFRTLTADGQTTLHFLNNDLMDSNLSPIPAAWQDGTVIISTPDFTAPSVPTGLAATAVSTSQINLSWSASSDNVAVIGYRIYRNNSLIATTGATSYQNTDLTPAIIYAYQVSAVDAAGNESAGSAIVSATTQTPPDTTAPSIPTGMTAIAISTNQINLIWDASTDDRGGIVSYRIYRNGAFLAAINGAYYQNTGLPSAFTYMYQVSAVDSAGNESMRSASASATTLTPADTIAPSVPILSGVIVSSSQLNLSWTAASDNVAVTGYEIYRDNILIAEINRLDYQNTGLSPATSYSYTVVARDAAGNRSAVSNVATLTTLSLADTSAPSVPTGLRLVSATTNQINIAWNSSTDNVAVTGYKVYRNNVYMMTVVTPAYYNAGLPSTTTYNYQVSAVDAAGNESARTVAFSATTLAVTQTDKTAPTVPAYLRANLFAATTINLSWYASNDYAFGGVQPSGVAGYRIYRNNIWITNVSATNYSDSALAKSTGYTYQVVSYDWAGNDSAKSNTVQIATSGTDKTKPNVPGYLRKKGSTPYSIEIAWNAATDPSGYLASASGVVGYKIYRNGAYLATVSTLSYDDKNLISQTSYRYQVSALDGAGNESALSGILIALTDLAPDVVAPTVPTNLRVNYNLFYYPKDARLYWYGSRDNRSGQIKYNIYRNGELINSITAVSYADKLSNYGVYNYQVKAVDVAGNESAGSNIISINYAPDTTAPNAPINLRYSYNLYYYPKDVRLYWYGSRDERPGRVSYNIYRNGDFIASTTWTSYYQKLSAYGVYQYQIKAVDIAGNESAWSNMVSINYAPDTTAPNIPASFRVYQDYRDKSMVRGYWYGVRDERPGQVKYNIYRNGEKISISIWNNFYDKLTARGNYQYQVSAIDLAGNESAKTAAVTIIW